jgi:hypothetical protein
MSIETPENDKLRAAAQERDTAMDFLEWLRGQGVLLTEMVQDYNFPQPIRESDDTLVMRYLDINTTKLETERRAILNAYVNGGAA